MKALWRRLVFENGEQTGRDIQPWASPLAINTSRAPSGKGGDPTLFPVLIPATGFIRLFEIPRS